MKRILLIFCLLVHLYCLSQPSSTPASLLLIGTVHNGNSQFNHKTLYRLLQALNPDVVLWEQNIPFKKVFGLRTASFLGIWQPGIEQRALQRYTGRNKNCNILPYDTALGNRHVYIATGKKQLAQLYAYLDKARMTPADSSGYSAFRGEEAIYNEVLHRASLAMLNQQPELMEQTKSLYALRAALIAPLANRYLSDTALAKWYHQDQAFWNARNEYMVQQIRQAAKAFPGKKIIVLTGFDHRYFLHDRLTALNDEAYHLVVPSFEREHR